MERGKEVSGQWKGKRERKRGRGRKKREKEKGRGKEKEIKGEGKSGKENEEGEKKKDRKEGTHVYPYLTKALLILLPLPFLLSAVLLFSDLVHNVGRKTLYLHESCEERQRHM